MVNSLTISSAFKLWYDRYFWGMNQHSEEKTPPNILALKSGHFTISLYRALLHKEVDITYKNDQDHSAILNLSLIYNLSIE